MKRWVLSVLAAALLLPFAAVANTDIVVFPTELSVSFNTASGQVVLAGDQVLFWSDSAAYPSFYFAKSLVQRSVVANGILSVELSQPVPIQAGSRGRFDFRILGGSDSTAIEHWFTQPAGTPVSANLGGPSAAPAATPSPVRYSFDAEHARFMRGNRNGKLVFNAEGVSWESLDDATQSRTWPYKSIRRLERKNPYELVIDTFSDGKFSFKLTTKPIGNEEFSAITDDLASARAAARQ